MADGKSQIEKVMSTTAQDTLTAWRTAGAVAANKKMGARRSLQNKLERVCREGDAAQIVKALLLSELTPAEREAVRELVPASIPDSGISPLVAIVYSVVHRTIKTGDAASLERLLRLAGVTPELQIKLGNADGKPFALLDLGSMTDEELRRLADRQLEVVDEDD